MKTYRLINDDGGFYISGTVDGIDAALLDIFLMLETERGEYPIYGRSYGISRKALRSGRMPYAVSMLTRQITEAVAERRGDVIRVSSVSAEADGGHLRLTVRFAAKETNETLTEVFNV